MDRYAFVASKAMLNAYFPTTDIIEYNDCKVKSFATILYFLR